MPGPEQTDVKRIAPAPEEREEQVAVNWDDVMGPREKAKTEPVAKVEAAPPKVEGDRTQEIVRANDITGQIKDQDVLKAATHVGNAELAANLVAMNEMKKPDNTQITVPGADGKPVNTTIGEYRKQVIERLKQSTEFSDFNDAGKLREFVSQSTEAALKIAQAAREKLEIGAMASDKNLNAREALAKELGFTPAITVQMPDGKGGTAPHDVYQVTKADVDARMQASKTPEEKAKLQQLSTLLNENDGIQTERQALSGVQIRSAQLMMAGMTHKPGEEVMGQTGATRQEIMRAYETVNTAGRTNRMLEQTPQFQAIKENSGLMYADIQLQRSRDAVLALQAADKLRSEGKPEAEVRAKYEEALKNVQGADMAMVRASFISQEKEYNQTLAKFNALAETPENQQQRQRLAQELMQRENIGAQLQQSMLASKEVKTQYATYLNEQGKGNEALPLLTSAMTETPELTAKDPTVAEQLGKAQQGKSLENVDTRAAGLAYEKAVADKNWAEAEKQLGILKTASDSAGQLAIQNTKDHISTVDTTKAKLQTELDDLKKNNVMDAAAKAIREEQLTNEIKGYDAMRKAYTDQLGPMEEAARVQSNKMKYMEGVLALSKDDQPNAHRIFEELKASAPELANNKEYQLDELVEATREKGWLERHWDTIVNVGKIAAIGVAILAAGAVTGGVGAVVLTGALVGAGGVFAVGAAGHYGAKAMDFKSTDNYNNWRPGQDLLIGAAAGGGGAALQALFTSGGALSSSVLGSSRIGQAAITTGRFATSGTGALATGTSVGFGHQAIERFNGNKEWNTYLADATMESAGVSAALYSAGKFGLGGNGGSFLASLKGPALVGASISGQEQARAVYHGKDKLEALTDFGTGTLSYGSLAMLGGQAGNLYKGLDAVKLGQASTLRELPSVALSNGGSMGKAIVYDGLLTGMKPGTQKAIAFGAPALFGGYVEYKDYTHSQDIKTPKAWDTDDDAKRMQMSQTMDALNRRIGRPEIKKPK